MNQAHSLRSRLRTGASLLAVAAAVYVVSCALVVGQDTNSQAAKPADQKPADPKPTDTKPADAKAAEGKKAKSPVKKLTGAELYSVHCNRCHPERYPTEFNPAEWKTLMTHMRVRANLPAKQAREILKYLQEESGS